MCPKDKFVAISHSGGTLEIWNVNTMFYRYNPKAYRILKNIADSDFIFYYDENWLRIVTLLGIKSEDYDETQKFDT